MPRRKKRYRKREFGHGELRKRGVVLIVYQRPIPKIERDHWHYRDCAREFWYVYLGLDEHSEIMASAERTDVYDKRHCIPRVIRQIAKAAEFVEIGNANQQRFLEEQKRQKTRR